MLKWRCTDKSTNIVLVMQLWVHFPAALWLLTLTSRNRPPNGPGHKDSEYAYIAISPNQPLC